MKPSVSKTVNGNASNVIVPPSRRTIHHDLIAEQADLGVAQDIDGFVFSQFGFGGEEQRAGVNVGRLGVAGQEAEVGFVAAQKLRRSDMFIARVVPSNL